jgi:hypothetical protein
MKYQNALVSAVMMVLGAITLTGMAYSDEYPQAAASESVGFDALAHNLFDGSKMACADDQPQVAQASVQ